MPFLRRFIVVVCAIAIASPSSAAADAHAGWAEQRAAVRAGRARLRDGATKFLADQSTRAAKLVGQLVDEAEAHPAAGQDADLAQLVDGLSAIDAGAAEPLRARVAALAKRPAPPPDAHGDWQRALDQKRKALLTPFEQMAQKAVAADVADVAFALMTSVLGFWPDHATLHHNLGQQRHGDRWYGPHEMKLVDAGLVWDAKLGWVVEKQRERYARGDYFDVQRKRWTDLAEADVFHAAAEHPWAIDTEHLRVQGTAKLADLVDTANRLEPFYAQVFAAYSGFFAPEGKRDLRLVFGMLDHPPLVVNVARDVEDYRRSLPAGVDPGWSAGMYVGQAEASFFYAGYVEAVYHEFTHHILSVFSERDRAPAWLVEGVAVYNEAPVFEHGRLELGRLDRHRKIQRYLAKAVAGTAMPLAQILALTDGAAWSAATAEQARDNYPAAGALCAFCMEADGRAYRSDFVDFVRDSYLGATAGHPVWEYLGLDRERFASAFAEWTKAHGPKR